MKLSLDALKTIYAEETGDYPILLLTISHSSLNEDILLSTDATNRISSLTTDRQVVYGTVSNGKNYVYCPMTITLPSEDEQAAPQSKVSISNIGGDLTRSIREMEGSPKVNFKIILASRPDFIEGEMSDFTFESIDMDIMTISGTLFLDIMTNEPFPYRTCTPATTPGLFQA